MIETTPEVRRQLTHLLGSRAQFDVPLHRFSHWRIGGSAAAVVEPATIDELQKVRRLLSEQEAMSLVVGSTSNLLFDSAGFNGVLIRIADQMSGVRIERDGVTALAGTPVPVLARTTADAGLAGLEHIVGIPGTIGGLVVMNGGSQRKDIGSSVREITGVDMNGESCLLSTSSLALGYRTSGIESKNIAIATVRLQLPDQAAPAMLHQRMDAIVEERAAKFPVNSPSCGSTFLSDPEMYAEVGPPGKAIEDAGLKGLRHGGARISPQHANFIVNDGDATSDDVLRLIKVSQDAVLARTGHLMSCEVRYVSPSGGVMAADLAAQHRPDGKP